MSLKIKDIRVGRTNGIREQGAGSNSQLQVGETKRGAQLLENTYESIMLSIEVWLFANLCDAPSK